jgi:hypothetical protein
MSSQQRNTYFVRLYVCGPMKRLRGTAEGLLSSRGDSWNLTSGSCCAPVWLIHLHTASRTVDHQSMMQHS